VRGVSCFDRQKPRHAPLPRPLGLLLPYRCHLGRATREPRKASKRDGGLNLCMMPATTAAEPFQFTILNGASLRKRRSALAQAATINPVGAIPFALAPVGHSLFAPQALHSLHLRRGACSVGLGGAKWLGPFPQVQCARSILSNALGAGRLALRFGPRNFLTE